MAANPLPGMPTQVGDPGVFLCSRDDLEPWNRPVRKSAHAGALGEQDRARPGVWLVLALCHDCNYRTRRYCPRHDMRRYNR